MANKELIQEAILTGFDADFLAGINDSDQYVLFLIKAAAKWGSPDPDEARRAHKVIETLIFEDRGCPQKIRLFTYNGQYGFCLNIRLKGQWSAYGPFFGFSDPHPTSRLALDAAIIKIIKTAQEHGSPAEKRKVVAWAKSLITPKQLRLI